VKAINFWQRAGLRRDGLAVMQLGSSRVWLKACRHLLERNLSKPAK
jgi:hypothetical protein